MLTNNLSTGQYAFEVTSSAGNVWLPKLAIIRPLNISEGLDKELRSLLFHERAPLFENNDFQRDSIIYQADGVIRNFRFDFKYQLSDRQTIGIVLNGHLLTGGNTAINALASDRFIEWFHSSVINDEDPFSRKIFPFNQARVSYKDELGREFDWERDEFILSNLELSYQQEIFKTDLQSLNISGHLMIPLSIMNPNLGAGVGLHWGYILPFRSNKAFIFMTSANIVNQDIFSLYDGVHPINRKFSAGFDGYAGYQKVNKTHTFSVGLQIINQQSLRRGSSMKKSFETLMFQGLHGANEKVEWEHQAAISMNSLLQNWNLIFTLENKKGRLAFYLQEDFWVNNAPDIQYGLSGMIKF